jgi:hypothetical protein
MAEMATAVSGWMTKPGGLGISETVGSGPWAATVTPAMGSADLSALQGRITAQEMLMQRTSGIVGLINGVGGGLLSAVQASQERTASEMKLKQISDEAAKRIGATRVAMAASGLDISSGDAIEGSIVADAGQQMKIERNNAVLRSLATSLRGTGALTKGVLDLAGGMHRADMAGQKLELDLAKRG